jgi:antitoxin component YwqK of YwqJK toxin-antitoxin module
MKKVLCLLFLFCLGCSLPDNGRLHPNVSISRNDPALYRHQGQWRYKGNIFSGYIIQEQNHLIVSKAPIVNGLTNGQAVSFYENGHPMLEQSFTNDKLDGPYKQWWRNGQLRYLFFYKDDQYVGTQKVFFENGKLREEANYTAGKLDGLQRVWDGNGQLVSNYTIRNNKIYGIISIESCLPH